MPMMQVGIPGTPDANQVTTKPRQMPSGGGGGDGVPLGGDTDSAETPFGEGNFEPDSNGANIEQERAENSDPEDDPDDHDDGDNGMEPETYARPATTKPSPVVARILAMADEVLDTNPGLDRRMAMVLSTVAMADVLKAEGIYQYDPGAHTHDFATGQSMFNRYLRDMHKLIPDPKSPQGEPGTPNPMRSTRAEEFLGETGQAAKDMAKDLAQRGMDKIRQRLRPKGPAGQGDPDLPDDAEPKMPLPDFLQDEPKTMGEMHRRTMEKYPSTQKDLWSQRHDPRPYTPEGYPTSDQYQPDERLPW